MDPARPRGRPGPATASSGESALRTAAPGSVGHSPPSPPRGRASPHRPVVTDAGSRSVQGELPHSRGHAAVFGDAPVVAADVRGLDVQRGS